MGQKINPKLMRLGIVKDWENTWFSIQDYPELILEDFYIRNLIRTELSRAAVSDIKIKRMSDYIEIIVTVARPGIIFGRNGLDLNLYKEALSEKTGRKVNIKIVEEKVPDTSSRLLSLLVAGQIEKRVPFRRAMKMAVQRALKSGAEGVKIYCAGRLGGVEIARSEWYREGRVPLHTIRANIDYSFTEAITTYGKIGVRVWVYKGDIFDGIPVEKYTFVKEGK
jgi:small subunit ribosomal protein S3